MTDGLPSLLKETQSLFRVLEPFISPGVRSFEGTSVVTEQPEAKQDLENILVCFFALVTTDGQIKRFLADAFNSPIFRSFVGCKVQAMSVRCNLSYRKLSFCASQTKTIKQSPQISVVFWSVYFSDLYRCYDVSSELRRIVQNRYLQESYKGAEVFKEVLYRRTSKAPPYITLEGSDCRKLFRRAVADDMS